MEAADSPSVNGGVPPVEQQLVELFGSYRAESLHERIYDLFTAPSYFPELQSRQSCVLSGGRGTGKTTVLRGLSYSGQFVSSGRNASAINSWRWIGLYHRINTNHVTAFSGPELTSSRWTSLFAHYFNLVLCELVLEYLGWYEIVTKTAVNLDPDDCELFALSLGLPPARQHAELRRALVRSRVVFESYLNNVVDESQPTVSLQGAPLELLIKATLQHPAFSGKQFFFLVDEFENLSDDQQRVVNTLIKHSSGDYCFKIGVKELGQRCRTTLNENETFQAPADYALIPIASRMSEGVFKEFAQQVCAARLAQIKTPHKGMALNLPSIFPGYTAEEEAEILEVGSHIPAIKRSLAQFASDVQSSALQNWAALQVYFLEYWAKSAKMSLEAALQEALAAPREWETRYNNYKYAALFAIRRGKRGINKYYCGWETLCGIASGNIRYLMSLVDQSLLEHLRNGGSLSTPVPQRLQTEVAQRIGNTVLSELEGLSVHGARITKLVLSLGRVFQVMAAEPEGHAPEVNQFQVGPSQDHSIEEAVERIISAGVMHLALNRFHGNKPEGPGDTKDYAYMIHPIMSPFFVFSHRLKRKMTLAPETIMSLIEKPKDTIRKVLEVRGRTIEQELPEQMSLFDRFYNADA